MSTSTRGFASMDKDRLREICAAGGRAVKPENRTYSRNRKLAAESGKKGGGNVSDENRSFSLNHKLAASAGQKGGFVTQQRRREAE